MLTSNIILSCLLLNLAFVLGEPDEDPECRPPHHHRKHDEEGCCNIPKLFPKTDDEMHELMHKCFDEAGIKKPGHHGSHVIPPPSPIDHSAFDCVEQCYLKNLELLNDDEELKTDEIKALIEKNFAGDWAEVGSIIIDKCLEKAKTDMDESSKCKAGSMRVMKCINREQFLNCPTSQWTESDACTAVKERLNKCPNAIAPFHYHKH